MRFVEPRAAVEHYDYVRHPTLGHLEPEIPEEPGEVHAVLPSKPRARHLEQLMRSKEIFFVEDGPLERAMCGRSTSVVLPMFFTSSGSDVCARCAKEVDERRADPIAWLERQSDRNAVRAQRREDREVIEEYRQMQTQKALLAERQRLLGKRESSAGNERLG